MRLDIGSRVELEALAMNRERARVRHDGIYITSREFQVYVVQKKEKQYEVYEQR